MTVLFDCAEPWVPCLNETWAKAYAIDEDRTERYPPPTPAAVPKALQNVRRCHYQSTGFSQCAFEQGAACIESPFFPADANSTGRSGGV